MKVPTLPLYSKFIVIDKDNNQHEVSDRLIFGCFGMCQYLEDSFGIKTVPSTVYNGKKKFVPIQFPYKRTKEYYLAYLNWILNYPKEERADFFDNEIDAIKFYTNNPIVDFYIIVKRR